jgi:hypothetical protein
LLDQNTGSAFLPHGILQLRPILMLLESVRILARCGGILQESACWSSSFSLFRRSNWQGKQAKA